MMFSSNQKLEVSGCLSHKDELYTALEFALKISGNLSAFNNVTKADIRCVYQITNDGRYCIGKSYGKPEDGWNEFPFDFDLSIISQIIIKHLNKQHINYSGYDGGYEKGRLRLDQDDGPCP